MEKVEVFSSPSESGHSILACLGAKKPIFAFLKTIFKDFFSD